MRTAAASITIDRPLEDVRAYLLDIGTRPEFAPTLFRDFRLTRVESQGVGAGARYRLHRKMRDRYAGTTITRSDAEGVLEEGSTGRGGRVKMAIEWQLTEQPGGATKVDWLIETYPTNIADRTREFRMRGQLRRRMRSSLRRLRAILEQSPSAVRGDRATINGMDPSYVPNP